MIKPAPFSQLGKFIYHKRFVILFLWIILLFISFPFLPHIVTPFKTTGFVDNTSASVKVDNYLNKHLKFRNNNEILISYTSKNLSVDNPLFLKKIKDSLSDLNDFPIKLEIIYPDDDHKQQHSKGKHSAFVVVLFKTTEILNEQEIRHFKSLIKTPSAMTLRLGGEPIFVNDINVQTKKDLFRADILAAPFSILIMVLVFGSLIAALIPIVLAASCAITILVSLFFLGHMLSLSIFTINIALLLGLCLCLDYSLFIMYRFKSELARARAHAEQTRAVTDQKTPLQPLLIEEVIATTLATAGKAVFFSGLAVFVSLAALLIFPITILFSIGIGGLVAVFFAVITSIFLLPAVLSIAQNKVDHFSVPNFLKKKPTSKHFWRWLAETVVARPLFFFFTCLIILLLLGAPFLKVKFGLSDILILPEHTESRKFLDHYKKTFNEQDLKPLIIVLRSHSDILSEHALDKLYDLSKKIKDMPEVDKVNSLVTINKKLNKNQYYLLYKPENRNDNTNQLLRTTTRTHFTKIMVISKYPADSKETKHLIKKLKTMHPGKGFRMSLTGNPVNNVEVLAKIDALFPYALLWIIVLTYCILLVLLRSLFLPIKAILMNIVSLAASYGVLVFVFQEGHLHNLLNFAPQGILDTSLLIIIFCALFGFSMDYEVFLLTRIKEFYEKTHNNKASIILGIDQSSRIITSAAIIVIVLCGSFMVADVLMVKEFGLGIAIAIFVDAFIVRSLLVPATMALVKQWNWYLPKWLAKLLPKI